MALLALHAPAVTPQEILEDAVLDAADFMRREGLMLFELLDTLGDDKGAEATLNLLALSSAPLPDHRAAAAELATVLAALEGISLLRLDEIFHSGQAPSDIPGAVRWAGARLTDLVTRLTNG